MHKSSASSQPRESQSRSEKVDANPRHIIQSYIKHILSTVKDLTRVIKRSHNVNTTDERRSKGLPTASCPTELLHRDWRGRAWTGGVGCVRRRRSKEPARVGWSRVLQTGTPVGQVSVVGAPLISFSLWTGKTGYTRIPSSWKFPRLIHRTLQSPEHRFSTETNIWTNGDDKTI